MPDRICRRHAGFYLRSRVQSFVPHERRTVFLISMLRCLVIFLLIAFHGSANAEFGHDSDMAVRLDERSDRDLRAQYRFRLRPSFVVNEQWSWHGFIATGSEFESAYNTIDDNDDQLHVRRLFARYETGQGKLEFGVIPPFKGRVSSTGLSKEGWIKGARGVVRTASGAFEVVLGDLEDLRSKNALSKDFSLNYTEFEYSADIDDRWSYELGAERMFDSRFLRTELRFRPRQGAAVTGEFIHNFTSGSSKFVISQQKEFSFSNGDLEWFAYYTYTGEDFGRRADLSEDFLEFGHAVAAKLEGGFSSFDRAGWFAELEVYENSSRLKLGFELSLN